MIHANQAGWAGIEPRAYKERPDLFRDVVRYTLLGGRDADEPLSFEVRYFEIAPGGYSSLEHHAHAHAVLVVKGQGMVRLGTRGETICPWDVVYVAPHEVHRFYAGDSEPLGFICVVDRDRDRPLVVDEDAPRYEGGPSHGGGPAG